MRRRTAIKTLGALAGSAAAGRLLGACDGAPSAPPGITTIVALMMENRSYDHYLGARALLESLPGDGLAAGMDNPSRAGGRVEIFRETVPCVPDPPHSWDGSRAQFAGGANDGFLYSYQDRHGYGVAPHCMGYFGRDELPVTWALADAYTSCDRWFCSVMGPTWPNRMYWHAAQSSGLKSNTLPSDGALSSTTIHHRLDDAGIDWAYYFSDLPVLGLWGNLELDGRVRRVVYDFFDDAAAGTLPPVCLIDPPFGSADDHPPHHPLMGQYFIASIYSALASSPQWNELLFVITYDEHGGFFDHVAPPKVADDRAADGFDQLGFRVPALVLGPYARAGHVSSVVYDHTSLAAHVERWLGLPPLTSRDAAAADLSDCIDADRLAAGEPAPAAAIPAVEVDESQLDDACTARRRRAPRAIERLAEAGFFPPRYDARARLPETLRALGEVLEQRGAGRIRRGR